MRYVPVRFLVAVFMTSSWGGARKATSSARTGPLPRPGEARRCDRLGRTLTAMARTRAGSSRRVALRRSAVDGGRAAAGG